MRTQKIAFTGVYLNYNQNISLWHLHDSIGASKDTMLIAPSSVGQLRSYEKIPNLFIRDDEHGNHYTRFQRLLDRQRLEREKFEELSPDAAKEYLLAKTKRSKKKLYSFDVSELEQIYYDQKLKLAKKFLKDIISIDDNTINKMKINMISAINKGLKTATNYKTGKAII